MLLKRLHCNSLQIQPDAIFVSIHGHNTHSSTRASEPHSHVDLTDDLPSYIYFVDQWKENRGRDESEISRGRGNTGEGEGKGTNRDHFSSSHVT